MRLLSLVLVSCFLLGAAALPARDDVEKLIEYLRQKLICGTENLPSMDPLHMEQLNISGLELRDLYGHGITDFEVTKVVLLPMGFTLTWPNPIAIQSNYSGSIELFDILKLNGDGIISMTLDRLEVRMQLYFNNLDGMVNFYEVKFILIDAADSSVISITGLLYDEDESLIIREELVGTLTLKIGTDSTRNWLIELLTPLILEILSTELSLSYDDWMDGNLDSLQPQPCARVS